MNVLLLKAWLADHAPGLTGARLRDVQQVDAKSFAVRFVGAHGCAPGGAGVTPVNHAAGAQPCAPTDQWLFVSILEGYPTLAMLPDGDPLLTQQPAESGFVKALRFHLAGATLKSIDQQGFDRSVLFDFARRDIYGRETQRTLRVELVGRASNAYLLSEKQMVISMLKPVPPGRNSVRRVVTGRPLPSPPPLGKFVAEDGIDALRGALQQATVANPAEPIRELLTRHVAGVDVSLWSQLEPLTPIDADEGDLLDFITELQSGNLTPVIYNFEEDQANERTIDIWKSQRSGATPSPKATGPADNRRFQLQAQLALAQRAEQLETAGLEMLARAKSFSNRETESAFLRGWQIAQPDWAERIDLAKSAEDNAGAVIEYAQRLKRARPRLEEMLQTTGVQTSGLRSGKLVEDAQSGALHATPDPLTRDIAKLERSGVKYLRYVTSDGIAILVGQSDRSNDELVRHYGSSRHLWLHVRDYPGSHVLLLTNGRDVPQRSLEEAAVIAGYYSQGRGEIDLEVSYTPVKQLRRPRGGKPGQVLKLSEKVIRVNPMKFEALRDSLRV